MRDVIPAGRSGRAEVQHLPDRVQLNVDGVGVMNDSAAVRACYAGVTERLRGRVLIVGLGLGYAVRSLLEREDVARVVVLEKYRDVIVLVAPPLLALDRRSVLEVVEADAFTVYLDGHAPFDAVYLDCWNVLTAEVRREQRALVERYRRWLAPGGYISYWQEKTSSCPCCGVAGTDGLVCETCAEVAVEKMWDKIPVARRA